MPGGKPAWGYATYDVPRPSSALGGLAQLARAPALQAGGQRFESVILHEFVRIADRRSQSVKIRDELRSLTYCDRKDTR